MSFLHSLEQLLGGGHSTQAPAQSTQPITDHANIDLLHKQMRAPRTIPNALTYAQSNDPAPQHQTTYSQAQQQQMTPVGQPIPQDMMNSFSPQTRQLAQIYQNNPMDPRVMHLDPKMFGYQPDNTVPAMHQPLTLSGNFGQQYGNYSQGMNIQGAQNPGLIPVQGSQFHNYMPIQNGYDQKIQF